MILTSLLFSMIAAAQVKIAVTVDDLPAHGPANVPRLEIAKKIVNALQKAGVPQAYGFVNGGEGDPELKAILKIWTDAGYPLANHTFTHANPNQLTFTQFQNEVEENERVLAANSKSDWHFFRFPYLNEGATPAAHAAIRTYLSQRGYKIASVTMDFSDWAWNIAYANCQATNNSLAIQHLQMTYLENAKTELMRSQKLSQALFGRQIPFVLLTHLGAFDSENIAAVLDMYKKSGVEFITLDEALKDPVYANDYPTVKGGGFFDQTLRARGLTSEDVGVPSTMSPPTSECL